MSKTRGRRLRSEERLQLVERAIGELFERTSFIMAAISSSVDEPKSIIEVPGQPPRRRITTLQDAYDAHCRQRAAEANGHKPA